MKKLLYIFLFILFISSCTTTKYVEIPVENTKVEYRNRYTIDTIYKTDSTIITDKGDTVFIEKYKYLYKIKEIRDTVNITDTITVVNTVEVTKEINKIHNWQLILMILGGGLLGLIGYKILKIFK
jgi:hypothetical protein